MIRRSLVVLSILSAGAVIACGDSGTGGSGGSGGDNPGGNDPQGGGGNDSQGGGGNDPQGGGGGGPDLCGNGSVDTGEECDGNDLDGNACTDVGFDGGVLDCAADCTYDTSGCTTAECGDGMINGTEDCDGSMLGGATCVSEGFDSGDLACANNCAFDTSDCVNISCGDSIINGTEDCDGSMLGAGTCQTEGFDGGTLACAANCAYNTAGCANEQCTDGVSNDGDADIDCADMNCQAECADACNTVPTILDPSVTSGTTVGHADVFDSACPIAELGAGAGEVVYQVMPAMTGVMDITLSSATDQGVSAWSGCNTGEIACDDSNIGGTDESITIAVTMGTPVFIMVEGYNAVADLGPFTLDIASRPIVCGDNIQDPGEACDDGNLVNDDGCSSTCVVECGDGTCGINETSCGCPADCVNVANACEACECGQAFPVGNTCACDDSCIDFQDCCGNEAPTCGSQPYTFTLTNNTSTVVPDGTYSGALASMACVSLPATFLPTATVTSVNSVTVGMTHTWMGDMTLKLVSPAGTVITLLSRPGFVEPADDGNGCCGTSADAVATGLIRFVTGAATSAEAMAGTVVCAAGTTCDFAPAAGAATPGNLTTLAGQAVNGTWQLCGGDSFTGDPGTILSVAIDITAD